MNNHQIEAVELRAQNRCEGCSLPRGTCGYMGKGQFIPCSETEFEMRARYRWVVVRLQLSIHVMPGGGVKLLCQLCKEKQAESEAPKAEQAEMFSLNPNEGTGTYGKEKRKARSPR